MGIYSLGQHVPRIHETAWIAKSAKVIGRVAMAENSSVWFGAVVRGDVEDIRIGRNTNICKNAVAAHGGHRIGVCFFICSRCYTKIAILGIDGI